VPELCQAPESRGEPRVNLATILDEAAARAPTRPALLLDDGGRVAPVSYEELLLRAAAAAEDLRGRGVRVGDRVAVVLPNGVDFVAAYFGALRVGAIVVPLNPLLAAPEIADRLGRAEPRATVDAPPAFEPRARATAVPAPVERQDDDVAALLFTSGTSGTAKGAMLTHGGLRAAARGAAEALALSGDDVVLGAAPFSHVLGQATGILATLSAGAAVAVVTRFEPHETLRFMAATGTTILLGVPTMCIGLCRAAREAEHRALPPLRVAHVGGAPVPPEVARDVERTLGAELREGYGLTELSGLATTFLPGEERRPGSVGRPLPGTEVRVVSPAGEPLPAGEVGEVQFRGPAVVPGYWRDAEATRAALAADGWLSTGDLGVLDDDGYLTLVDRKKELIIRGGYNVYPREVEDVLHAHPGVLEAAVVGVPHDVLGEEVLAVVVRREGATLDEATLQAFARERVAAYKYPRHVVFVDALPKGPTGKVLKRALDPAALLRTREEAATG
jgi:long-chain acyl-CoA synthetase